MAGAAPVIRAPRPDDREAWEPLWRGYLTFYRADLAPDVTDFTWNRLVDPAGPINGFVAEMDGRLVGITHYLFHPSCWTRGDYCYLQDLFVDARARGGGVARRLIAAVEEAARAAGASRLYWLTQEHNHDARALYDKVAERSGFIQYRKIL